MSGDTSIPTLSSDNRTIILEMPNKISSFQTIELQFIHISHPYLFHHAKSRAPSKDLPSLSKQGQVDQCINRSFCKIGTLLGGSIDTIHLLPSRCKAHLFERAIEFEGPPCKSFDILISPATYKALFVVLRYRLSPGHAV